MIALALDRAALVVRPAPIAQLIGIDVSKTDQTAQSDQRIENAAKFDAGPGQKLTTPYQKLTSRIAQQPRLIVQVVAARIDSTHVPSSIAGPQP
jgi:hypothetical protein